MGYNVTSKGNNFISLCSGGRFTGTVANTWYSHAAQTIWDQGNASTAAGTGTDPSMTHNFLGMYIPANGKIIRVLFHFIINTTSDNGKMVLYKCRPTDASTTTTLTAVTTADFSILSPTINVSHLFDSGPLTEPVLTHDRLRLWHRAGATTQSTVSQFSCSVLIKLD